MFSLLQYLNTKKTPTPKKGGLNGGSSHYSPVNKQLILNVEDCTSDKMYV